MSQAERIARTHFLLRTRGTVTLAELKAEFEVSRATIMRDIELMRDRLFAPIRYDPEDNSYSYVPDTRDAGGDANGLFDLPGMWINAKEAYALLTVMNMMEKLDTGAMMPAVRALRPLLKRILCSRHFPMMGFHRKLAVELPNLRGYDVAVVNKMSKALVDEVQVMLEWRDPEGTVQSIPASVQQFVLGVNGWEADLLCDKTTSPRRIPLHQITACTLTETRANVLPGFARDPEADWAAIVQLDIR